jgi:hypothetical protein
MTPLYHRGGPWGVLGTYARGQQDRLRDIITLLHLACDKYALYLHACCTSGVWVSSSRLQCPTWEHCLGLSINCRCCVLGSRRSTAMCVIARICQEVPSRPGASVSNSQLCFVSHMHLHWLVSILAVIIKVVAHRSAHRFPSHESVLVAALLEVFIAAHVCILHPPALPV